MKDDARDVRRVLGSISTLPAFLQSVSLVQRRNHLVVAHPDIIPADILLSMMVEVIQDADCMPVLASEPETVGGCDITM